MRVLFLATVFLGFRRYFEQCVRYCERDPAVDAVHVALHAPLWQKVLGKSVPVVGATGWDLHGYRHLAMWRWVMNRWFAGPLPLARFDVVHVLTQGCAWSIVDQKRLTGGRVRFAANIDATAAQEAAELGYSPRARRPMIAAERQIFGAADLVVCRNRWASGSLGRDYGVPPERVTVARNSMRPPAASRADHPPRRPGERVRIAFVGNDFKRKGGPELLRLHQQRFADRAELHVFSSGAVPQPTARNVVWHGFVAHETLRDELLPSMDLFVIPTHMDMHPWAILEAAAAGLPVVSSRLAGIPEMVLDGTTGLLCPVGDMAAFAEAIDKLVGDGPTRLTMGAAARAHVIAAYDPDLQFGGLIERLKSLARPGVASA